MLLCVLILLPVATICLHTHVLPSIMNVLSLLPPKAKTSASALDSTPACFLKNMLLQTVSHWRISPCLPSLPSNLRRHVLGNFHFQTVELTLKKSQLIKSLIGVPFVAQKVKKQHRVCEDGVWSLASESGLTIRCCCKLWHRSQVHLGPSIVVAVAVACNCSCDWSLSLRCGYKKKNKETKKMVLQWLKGRIHPHYRYVCKEPHSQTSGSQIWLYIGIPWRVRKEINKSTAIWLLI